MLIDGKKIAAELRQEIKLEISQLKNKYKKVPGLTRIFLGLPRLADAYNLSTIIFSSCQFVK